MKKLSYVIAFSLIATIGYSQEELAPLVKPEVDEDQVMFQKTIWRRMDLKEKQNSSFFSINGEISTLLIQAVEEGLLTPYKSDSCINIMDDLTYRDNTSVESASASFGGGFDSGGFGSFDDPGAGGGQEEETEAKRDNIPARIFDKLYIREDLIFDRNRSRMYQYIRSLSLAIPRDAGSLYNPAGFEKRVAHFKYDEVVALFRGPYADRAIYYNNSNPGQHINMSDAFELRLFNAPIIKVSNSENLDIREQYADAMAKDPMSVIIIQQQKEFDLMEYESELWEY